MEMHYLLEHTSFIYNLFHLFIFIRNQVDKRTMLENLDYVLLALDELIDGGYDFHLFIHMESILTICFLLFHC